ncbi:phage scaffolding protein [Brevibacillus daliensis]|uniref:phage scaffolding protein n=1 Tax=Brevibacillus daliensis TaxID=2892995 RepID=UPI001E40B59F|nr:phage scaffolding protein [Brevibacillus daliensis]
MKNAIKTLIPMNLQYFAEVDPEQLTDTTPEPEKTFTQIELDEIVAKRLERDRKKYADYDEMKTKLAEIEKAEQVRKDAEMSELERLQTKLSEKDTYAQQLADQIEKLHEQSKQERIHGAFNKAAAAVNIKYVDDALRLADLSTVTVGEDGSITGIDEVVKALIESKPFLIERAQPKIIGSATILPDEKAEKTKEQILAEAAEKARKSGRMEDMALFAKLQRELNG